MLEVETPHGPARVRTHFVKKPRGALVLGHGAGGGIDAPDLVAAADVARSEGLSVALVEQPYRVAGRRSPAPANQLDAAWTGVVDHLRENDLRGLPLIVGGRSLGARVACRTVEATGAVAVLCLAFPLQPPRRSGGALRESRISELDGVDVPVLVVQGERDQFGMPPAGKRRTVVQVPGNHSLRADTEAVAAAIRTWLPGVVDTVAGAVR
jgi:predicted alpha/beta-hydrolase family hydrolase